MEESFDPSLNFLYRRHRQLDAVFAPRSVAVVGATEAEKSVGRTVMRNLQSHFKGSLFPVNPKRSEVFGVKAYPDLKAIGMPVDLVIVVTPAKAVSSIIAQAAELSIPAAVIISAGFKEMGPPGIALEQEILTHARKGKMRIVGPNCLGVMNPHTGLNATFAAAMAHPGNIAFISQSGALCTAVLDWSLREQIGFSAFVSIGSMVDVEFSDLIDYFGGDPNTKSILLYMEGIGDARAFLSAAREVALTKPIILIKAGRTAESAKAAASHTGALAGSDEALSAALRRVGVLRVDTIEELFGMAEVFAKQPLPHGPRLTIVTNAGGPGVIATDALVQEGGALTPLSETVMSQLNSFLPPHWSRNNPVDVLGDASAETYRKAAEVALQDPNSDGVLVILTPQDMTEPTGTAQQIADLAPKGKPLLASWMGADAVAKGDQILSVRGIPNFSYPDAACKAFAAMWRYSDQLRSIYETPSLLHGSEETARSRASAEIEAIFQTALSEGRTILDEYESKRVMTAYSIPTVPTEIATDASQAAKLAKKFGFPVVLKLFSRTITHKTDVGGVKLNLRDEAEVKAAFQAIRASVAKIAGESQFQGVTVQPMIRLDGYELILGSAVDPEFGPIVLFGSGGQLVEVYKDRSLGLPPLTTVLARRMMEPTKIYAALHGVRGRPRVNLEELEQILVQFGNLVVEHPRIRECDINPLLVSHERIIALDARIILHDPKIRKEELPRPAIRPYPVEYIEQWRTRDGTELLLRPIRPEDEKLFFRFHADLSQETVRQRYLKDLHYDERVAHERLQRICFIDYDREIALVAQEMKEKQIVGVARLTKIPASNEGTFGLIVKDSWQNQGVGSKLMEKLIQVAKAEQIQVLSAALLKENFQMEKLLRRFGFSLEPKGQHLLARWKIIP